MVFSRRPTAVGIDVCSNGGAVAVLWKNAGEPEVLCAESPAALLGDLRSKRVPWGNLRVVFPRKVLAVRQCELPSTETDEIRSMLAFELSDAPLFDGDSLFGFAFKDVVQKPGYSDVCAFLSSEQLAESFVRPLTEVGLVPEALLPSPAAVVAWMGAFADISGHGGETVLAVLVDATSMELVATRDGAVVYSRSAVWESGPAAGGKVSRQVVEGCLLAAERLKIVPQQILIIVPESLQDGLVAAVRGCWRKHVSPTERAETGGDVPVVRCAAPLRGGAGDVPQEMCASVARAAGAAASGGVPALASADLRPTSLRRRERRRRVGALALATAALCTALAVVCGVTLAFEVRGIRQRIAALHEQIDPIKETALSVSRKRQQLALVQSHLADRDLPLAVMAELYQRTPQGIYVTELKTTGSEVSITGQAESTDLAYSYLGKLMESDVLSKVTIHGTHPVSRSGSTLTEFTYTCEASLRPQEKGQTRP